MRGTLINAAGVGVGALLGMMAGAQLPRALEEMAMGGIGLVSLALGIKMFMATKNPVVCVAAIALGGILGYALGVQAGLETFAAWAERTVGGQGRFAEAIVTTSILFCIGPMTLLGCLEDGLTGRSDLLMLKSAMDSVGAFFFAATLGPGVFVTCLVILVYQGALTLLAKRLAFLRDRPTMIAEITAVGGLIIVAVGLGLLSIRPMRVADYLPALVVAPLVLAVIERWEPSRAA